MDDRACLHLKSGAMALIAVSTLTLGLQTIFAQTLSTLRVPACDEFVRFASRMPPHAIEQLFDMAFEEMRVADFDRAIQVVSRCRETLKSSSDRQARFVAWELILAPINNAWTTKLHREEGERHGAINCDIANANI